MWMVRITKLRIISLAGFGFLFISIMGMKSVNVDEEWERFLNDDSEARALLPSMKATWNFWQFLRINHPTFYITS